MFEFVLRPVRIERKLDEVLRLLNALKSTAAAVAANTPAA
jgi:hypothetical protein